MHFTAHYMPKELFLILFISMIFQYIMHRKIRTNQYCTKIHAKMSKQRNSNFKF